jgi:hypothetical protein
MSTDVTNVNQIVALPVLTEGYVYTAGVNGLPRDSSHFYEDSTGVGLGTISPIGILQIEKNATNNAQLGINLNVGPEDSLLTRDITTPMVQLSDTVTAFNAGTAILFQFSGNYQGMIGHGDVHVYDSSWGDSYYCHFSLRFSNDSTTAVTLDYGDITGVNQQFFNTDSTLVDTGVRLYINSYAGPNYNPLFRIKSNYDRNYNKVQLSYNLYLRKILFS